MYHWYEKAKVCCAHISDADSLDDLAGSEWFRRGWTLQELVAPFHVLFFNRHWQALGSRYSLRHIIAQPSGVDGDFLAGSTRLKEYSAAQIMSWASHRETSRVEDEAYCLLGLFKVNMPLLYGERREAFRRLQELIMAGSDDCSLFAWGLRSHGSEQGKLYPDASLLAPSPRQFKHSRDVQKGFATQRISFELTNRGMMVLIHRSYNPGVLDKLLRYASDHLDEAIEPSLRLTLPLGCFVRRSNGKEGFWGGCRTRHVFGRSDTCYPISESFILRLQLEGGKWRRISKRAMWMTVLGPNTSAVTTSPMQTTMYGYTYITIVGLRSRLSVLSSQRKSGCMYKIKRITGMGCHRVRMSDRV